MRSWCIVLWTLAVLVITTDSPSLCWCSWHRRGFISCRYWTRGPSASPRRNQGCQQRKTVDQVLKDTYGSVHGLWSPRPGLFTKVLLWYHMSALDAHYFITLQDDYGFISAPIPCHHQHPDCGPRKKTGLHPKTTLCRKEYIWIGKDDPDVTTLKSNFYAKDRATLLWLIFFCIGQFPQQQSDSVYSPIITVLINSHPGQLFQVSFIWIQYTQSNGPLLLSLTQSDIQ